MGKTYSDEFFREHGRRGGLATKKKHGKKFYKEILPKTRKNSGRKKKHV